jgi:hypothetical protein
MEIFRKQTKRRQSLWHSKFCLATNLLNKLTFSCLHRFYSQSLLAITRLKKRVNGVVTQRGHSSSVMQFQDSFQNLFLSLFGQDWRSISMFNLHSMKSLKYWGRLTSELLMKLIQKRFYHFLVQWNRLSCKWKEPLQTDIVILHSE